MPTVSIDDEPPIADAATPELHLLQRADVESLRRAIENLPLEFREVLLMSDVEEMSYRGNRGDAVDSDRDGDVAPDPGAAESA